ncbi:MAG: phosphoenolpyruvate--protein phosphotransferase [Proteobacteria bacterium]|nr:phosphoenolpyruvate--protein phosphotransferase [Pseudomonadota bacterium]
MHTQNHRFKAPLSGRLLPLEEVPDPVFAQKMLGDGVALDPSSNALLAPCDASVAHLHDAYHAITLQTESGLHVLLHIGIDTVQLKGEGFLPHVAVGQAVKAGDILIEFDPTYIRTHARSLLTAIVISDAESVSDLKVATGQVTAGRDIVLQLRAAAAGQKEVTPSSSQYTSDLISIANPAGLHARPAAALASATRQFTASITLRRGTGQANAKSVVSLMQLDVRQGDQVQLIASGDDAKHAIDTVVPQFEKTLRDASQQERATAPGREDGSGREPDPDTAARGETEHSSTAGLADEQPGSHISAGASGDVVDFAGKTASSGLALGTVFQLRRQNLVWPESTDNPLAEQRQLDRAIERARTTLQALHARLSERADPHQADIFAAQQEILDDPDITDMARRAIGHGKSAASAWHASISHHAGQLAQLDNELLAARASDLRDVGERVTRHLMGHAEGQLDVPDGAILIAEELTPSQASLLDRGHIRGFCTSLGTPNSHVAILARSLGVPAIVAMDARVLDVADGTTAIVDADRATLIISPSEQQIARCQERIEASTVARKEVIARAAEPAETRDGHRIKVLANISHESDVEQMSAHGAEGVGLLRSEFLFVDRSSAPDEVEQKRVYQDIATAVGPGRPLVVRTLDVGGDKPLAYLPMRYEENPFLGERGIRVGLKRPHILRAQLRAILSAACTMATDSPPLKVMFPMIATVDEWRAAKAIFDAERATLAAQMKANTSEKPVLPQVQVGIMVEVPAVAILAEAFAREVDFFSIGTNDLSQYTLAMDRGNPAFSAQLEGLAPSIIHLIARTVAGARKYDKGVSVCGNIASDPHALPILVGLGITELSVDVRSIPRIKQELRNMAFAECEAMAEKALQAATSAEVRALVAEHGV